MDLSGYALATLHQDGDVVLCRGRALDSPTPRLPSVLVSIPVSQHPAPAHVRMLEHEMALRGDLDPTWALRPLVLAHYQGRAALVLEDQPGEPLARLLDEAATRTPAGRETAEPAMELGLFLRLAIGLAGSLGEVHRRGIVHKNLKPAHVLVNAASGQVWLTGFGIASRLPRERQTPEPPETIAGTLAYMAPEQTGRMNRSIDCRSDLYALGVTLYQMLTGSLPFTAAEPIEWVHCHIARQPIPPGERRADVPAPVSAMVMKLLAKTGEERYQTAAGLKRDLRRCLAAWEAERRIDAFPLGEHDTPDRLLIPETLYGRAPQVETLLAAFDRVVRSGVPELVLVSGYSGIGKSSVVNELHKALVPPRALFAGGKFDQFKRDIPYSTLAQAFQSLVGPLLAKSDVELDQWREALHEALGPNGQLMVDLVPDLKLIIGAQAPVSDLPPRDAQRRFQLVFRRFLSVFARLEHPLALFLDDLQWLDAATLDLLEDLLAQPDVRYLLLIGAYRDNEVTSTHPLTRTLAAFQTAGARVQEIRLAPLTYADVGQLLVDSLHCGRDRAAALAQLMLEKTDGNPFFVIQFLSAMAEEDLLTFDHDSGRWSWDLAHIHTKGYTDNVVDLMVGKLSRLAIPTQAVLQQFACLGNSAECALLAMVCERSTQALDRDLGDALRAGLVLPSGDSYRFLHDRVQEAAYSQIPESKRVEAHLRIGRLLASHTPTDEQEETIFEIVNQLNRGAVLMTSGDETERLAHFNLRAGRRAKASTAYVSALTYLVAGATLLRDDGWERRPDLMLPLELHRAECELLTGELRTAEDRLTMLVARAVSSIDHATVACLRIDLYMMIDRNDRALEVCLAYMHYLGSAWSPQPTEADARREYDRMWSLLENREIETLIDLPVMSDATVVATLDVLSKALPPAVYTNANLLCMLVCQMITLSVIHGNTDGSCLAYAWMGRIAGYRFGNYAAGFRFGQLGYDLVERSGLERFKARTYITFGSYCVPWVTHVRAARDMLARAFDAANRSGDLPFAAFSFNNLVANLFASGDTLIDVQREAERGLAFARTAGFRAVIDLLTTQLCLIRTLRGLTTTFGSFNEPNFDELEYERSLSTGAVSGAPIGACRYWIRKLQARFIAADHVTAVHASAQVQRLLWTTPSVLELADFHFYGALSHAACCDATFPAQYREHVEALTAHHRQLADWAERCPENFQHRAALVGAEIARVQTRELEAERLYDAAIRSAQEHTFVHIEALANELAARFYAARGFETIAQAYLRNARYAYLRWGADGKVRQLDHRYPHLKAEASGVARTATIGAPLEQLDLATVIKVSQAVSGEMVLDKLLDTIMRAAIEHAGAARALLILSREADHRIAAEATASNETIVVRLRDERVIGSMLPETVLRYVLHTRESVVLDDAAIVNPFSGDPYIGQRRARSVLCVPLTNQGTPIGVLYLENNLAPGVFAPARIVVLKLLASLAANSLDNTRLYRDLAERERESRMIVDCIPGLVATLTPAGEVEAVNQQVLAYWGRPLAEINEWGTSDTVHPDDLPRAIAVVSEAMRSGEPYETAERIRRFDGVYRWFQVRGLPLRGSDGLIVRWYVLLTDIDERKRAEGLLAGEKRLLEMVASGRPLEDVLETMCDFVDTVVGQCACSILLVDSDGAFRLGAGPTLPPGYETAVNGAPVVCEAGPCGTAGSLREQVIVPDLLSDQRWVGLAWRSLVLAHGLRSVCSTPIVSSTGKVLGTFAIYQRAPEPPTALLTDLIARVTNVASIAIEGANNYRDLQARERESRTIVDSIPGMVALLTASGEVEVVNPQLIEYFGQAVEQLQQWRMSDTVHPEDLPHVIEVFTRSIASGSPYEIVQRFRRSDGVYRWFLNGGLPVRDPSGQIARWCVLLTDIDERKRAEDALRASEGNLQLIIDTIPALAWSARPDGRAEYFNQHYLDFLGVPATQAADWGWTAAVHPDDLAGLTVAWQRILASRRTGEAEARLRRQSDGAYRWFLFRANPLRDDAGSIVRWYGVNTDIEDRKRAEATLGALKDQLYKENLLLRDEVDRTSMFEEIVGTSPALQPVLTRVAKVARTDSTVLITGETGTGKELIARAIHRRSARASRAFVSVNCAAVPRELIASELFGHEKGAFTGATQRRLGRFELAHGGTIFLDEAGELPMETQVALLRVLQEREFERVGGSTTIRIDVRVVAATNRDLPAAIEAGTFRSDLYYRLNVFPIVVPALRERADDIPLLVEYFIDRYARKAGKTIRRLNKRTLDHLRSYPWPGNVRELQNVIERSVIVCDTDEFTVDESWVATRADIEGRLALSGSLAAHEKAIIEDALRASGGRVFGASGAAARLGIPRSTLESKIRALKISKSRFRSRPSKG